MCVRCKYSLHQSNVLFMEFHMQKVYDLTELKTAMIMCKVHKMILPENLQTMFKISFRSTYATSKSQNIRQVLTRTTKKLNV